MKKTGHGRAPLRAAQTGAALFLRLLFLLIALWVILWLGRSARNFAREVFCEEAAESPPGREIEVRIPEGAAAREIGRILKRSGLIRDVNVFLVQERLSPYHGRIRGGTFTLNTSMTPAEILEAMYDESGEYGESEDAAP